MRKTGSNRFRVNRAREMTYERWKERAGKDQAGRECTGRGGREGEA